MDNEKKTSRQLTETVSAYIQKFHMLKPGEKVIVGLSGGADSVCLFYVLLALREKFSFSMEAVHVNHMLRESADRDEAFVKELCDRNHILLHTLRKDVSAVARAEKLSLEEAGRCVRYDYFEKILRESGAQKIAVAHHMDDLAETILFHMSRGAGLDGLCGMRPVRDRIIRPLLCVNRTEIESYLKAIETDYMTDETNTDMEYSRNRIRHKVIPMLENEVCKGAAGHIARTGQIVMQARDYLEEQVQAAVRLCVDMQQAESGCVRIALEEFNRTHPYLQGEIIRFTIASLAGCKKDISAVHIDAVQKLAGQQVGSMCDLPYEIRVKKSYRELILRRGDARESGSEMFCVPVDAHGLEEGMQVILPDGRKVSLRVKEFDRSADIPTKAYTKWLDYDKIKKPLAVRTPMEGDYFYFDNKNKKYVKDYMVNEKIPQEERVKSILVAEGDHMLCFVGKRISNYFKADETTKRILEIVVTGG